MKIETIALMVVIILAILGFWEFGLKPGQNNEKLCAEILGIEDHNCWAFDAKPMYQKVDDTYFNCCYDSVVLHDENKGYYKEIICKGFEK